jgi:hypothetical protein
MAKRGTGNDWQATYQALLGDDEIAALAAAERIGKEGDATAIAHMAAALANSPHETVKRRLEALLGQVKAADALPQLMAVLGNPALAGAHRAIVAAVWSAGLDARDHLERFIDLAIKGGTEICFECLSVVQNQDVWPERAAREGLKRVRKAMESEQDPHKAELLADICVELDYRLGR